MALEIYSALYLWTCLSPACDNLIPYRVASSVNLTSLNWENEKLVASYSPCGDSPSCSQVPMDAIWNVDGQLLYLETCPAVGTLGQGTVIRCNAASYILVKYGGEMQTVPLPTEMPTVPLPTTSTTPLPTQKSDPANATFIQGSRSGQLPGPAIAVGLISFFLLAGIIFLVQKRRKPQETEPIYAEIDGMSGYEIPAVISAKSATCDTELNNTSPAFTIADNTIPTYDIGTQNSYQPGGTHEYSIARSISHQGADDDTYHAEHVRGRKLMSMPSIDTIHEEHEYNIAAQGTYPKDDECYLVVKPDSLFERAVENPAYDSQ